MTLILDASAALELVMGRPRRLAVASALREAEWVVAPSLYLYEAANAMWKYHRSSGLEARQLADRLAQAVDLVDEYLPADTLFGDALRLSCRLNQPAYDSAYLAAAQRRGGALLSLDQRVLASARKLAIKTTAELP